MARHIIPTYFDYGEAVIIQVAKTEKGSGNLHSPINRIRVYGHSQNTVCDFINRNLLYAESQYGTLRRVTQ